MRLIILLFTLTLTVSLGVIFNYSKPVPVPVVEPEVTPEQSPHVIYLFVCDKLEGVLVTGQPPMWANDAIPAGPTMLELMAEAGRAGRAHNIRHWHRGCPEAKI